MKKRGAKSLNILFIRSFFLSFALPLLVIGGIFFVLTIKLESTRVKDTNAVQASNISRIISVYLRRGKELLSGLSPLFSKDPDRYKAYLESIKNDDNFVGLFDFIYALDTSGTVLWAKAVGKPDTDTLAFSYTAITYKNKEFFNIARECSCSVWSETYTSLISGERTVTIIVPYKSGYLAGDIDMRRLIHVIRSLKISKKLSFTILDQYGNYIYHPKEEFLYEYSEIPKLMTDASDTALYHSFTYRDEDGLKMGSASHIDESLWIVVTSLKYFDAMGSAVTLAVLLLLLFLTMLILAFHSSLNTSRLIKSALNLIGARASSVAKGSYEYRTVTTGVTEFDNLHSSVNAMSDAVFSREREIQKARDAAEEQLQFQQTLIDTITMPIFVKDEDNRVILTNKACVELLGESSELLPQLDEQEERTTLFTDGKLHTVIVKHAEFMRKDRRKNSVVIVTDITERLNLEARMNHSEKLQAIGKLAGGIAHDVNNQLAGIMGFAEILKSEVEDNEMLLSYVNAIIEAVVQSSDITHQLLAFARQGKYSLKPVSLNEMAAGVHAMLRHTISRQISLELVTDPADPHIIADKSQVQNAILNLGINARDAIGDTSGTISVTVSHVTVTQKRSIHNNTIMNGSYATVTVCDTGSGIEKEVLEHIFDPFYTTKPEGKGTGMGLAAVYGTVTTHNGYIDIESTPGEGACFVIYFPLAEAEHSEVSEVESGREREVHGTILIVDDEEDILHSTSKLLEKKGFICYTARDGEEGVSLYQEKQNEINLVILDANMPRMNGYEAFRHIRDCTPYVPILLATGYADESKVQHLMSQEKCDYIHKPFHISDLVDKIVSLLSF